jgi:hypothetical protein
MCNNTFPGKASYFKLKYNNKLKKKLGMKRDKEGLVFLVINREM